MTDCQAEDKTCRLCGLADQSNLNIFRTRNVYEKVVSVYPIVLYQSDPLPKNICHKCYGNVVIKFDEFQRINKNQQKWINNVKKNQANNLYLQMLKLIEEANESIVGKLKKLSSDFFTDNFHILKFHQTNSNFNTCFDLHSDPQREKLFDPNQSSGLNMREISLLPSGKFDLKLPPQNYLDTFKIVETNDFGQIQRKLESNGCTLMTISEKKSLKIPKNYCKYCSKNFKNQSTLSIHQANQHLKVSVYKMFSRKALPKYLREAIQIIVDNKNWLRCKNCLNIFGNFESINNHWKMNRCTFFCKICGSDFSRDPKGLRQHLINVHSITYKNVQMCYKTFIRMKNSNTSKNESLSIQQKFNDENSKKKKENCRTRNSRNKAGLRVRTISELQSELLANSNDRNNGLSNLKLNTISLDISNRLELLDEI